MSQVVTIIAVQPPVEADRWVSENGTFQPYVVTVKSEAGNTRDAVWNRKRRDDGSFPPPDVGIRVDTDLVQTKRPPGWLLKSPKIVRDDGTVPSYNGAPRGTDQDRTADIHRQVALKAASSLFGPMLAQVDPMTSTTEWWTRFWALYDRAVDRLEVAITDRPAAQQQLPAAQDMPEVRRDVERTGQSDVPVDSKDFVPAGAVKDDEDIPF